MGQPALSYRQPQHVMAPAVAVQQLPPPAAPGTPPDEDMPAVALYHPSSLLPAAPSALCGTEPGQLRSQAGTPEQSDWTSALWTALHGDDDALPADPESPIRHLAQGSQVPDENTGLQAPPSGQPLHSSRKRARGSVAPQQPREVLATVQGVDIVKDQHLQPGDRNHYIRACVTCPFHSGQPPCKRSRTWGVSQIKRFGHLEPVGFVAAWLKQGS